MNQTSCKLAAVTAVVSAMFAVTDAHAQWYSSYPSAQPNPYSAQQPYAVEVAPNTYMIHRSSRARVDAPCIDCDRPVDDRPHHTHADRANQLAKHHKKHKGTVPTEVVNTKKIVTEKPVVIEHKHVVDGRPRVIERRHITEDTPGRGLIHPRREVGTEEVVTDPGEQETQQRAVLHPTKSKRVTRETKIRDVKIKEGGSKRVIRAEAEVTIFGPDRMSIRLFRKGHGGKDTNTEVVE